MYLWFKDAARALALDRQLAHDARLKGDFVMAAKLDAGSVFSEGIARVTGGKYSHVQCSIGMTEDRKSVDSFGCVEPGGAVLMPAFDYSGRALWDAIEIPTYDPQDFGIVGWSRGRLGRKYDFIDIAGIALGRPLCNRDSDICSRYAVELLQWQVAPPFLVGVKNACLVSPSGFVGDPHGRSGLFDLAIAAGYKVIA